MLEGPHFRERGLGVKIKHPTEGELNQIGLPVKFIFNKQEYTPGGEQLLPPPQWGQHTMEILQKMGYDDTALAELKAKGII